MTTEQLVALVTAIVTPMSGLIALWIREQSRARLRRRAHARQLESLEGVCRGIDAKIDDVAMRLRRVERALISRGVDLRNGRESVPDHDTPA